jgi:glycosyltransferase involved in cell wall biosynthesis
LTVVKNRNYDLIIADRADLRGIDDSFNAGALKIFLATSMNYALHNQNVRRRHERLFERRKSSIEIRRPYPEVMPYLAHSDAVVGFGNEFIMSTWKELFDGPIYPFNNYGFRETPFVFDGKDFAEARKHFLFFASRSQMQKGLDLLLEIFPKHPDLHLYICSQFDNEQDFCAVYRKEIYNTPNIHPIGWIKVNGAHYDELMKRCAYVIHPTCSEGQPGSVVQCMYSGLIPLVTNWAGIDTDDFGVSFDDSLEAIESAIVTVSRTTQEWHRQQSIRTRQVAEAKYSQDAFMNRWRQMLADIVGVQTKAAGILQSML